MCRHNVKTRLYVNFYPYFFYNGEQLFWRFRINKTRMYLFCVCIYITLMRVFKICTISTYIHTCTHFEHRFVVLVLFSNNEQCLLLKTHIFFLTINRKNIHLKTNSCSRNFVLLQIKLLRNCKHRILRAPGDQTTIYFVISVNL